MDRAKPDRPKSATSHEASLPERVLDALTAAVAAMQYGSIQLVVHDGKIVQLDVTERHRF